MFSRNLLRAVFLKALEVKWYEILNFIGSLLVMDIIIVKWEGFVNI